LSGRHDHDAVVNGLTPPWNSGVVEGNVNRVKMLNARRTAAPASRANDAVNAEILLRLRRTTRSIPSSTVVGGHQAIRPCFINPHTGLADVDVLVDHFITSATS